MFQPFAIWHYLSARFNLGGRRDDRGVVTAEMAVVIFILVGLAIAVLGAIAVATRNNAANIPVPDSVSDGG